jgi:hypothetical protein
MCHKHHAQPLLQLTLTTQRERKPLPYIFSSSSSASERGFMLHNMRVVQILYLPFLLSKPCMQAMPPHWSFPLHQANGVRRGSTGFRVDAITELEQCFWNRGCPKHHKLLRFVCPRHFEFSSGGSKNQNNTRLSRLTGHTRQSAYVWHCYVFLCHCLFLMFLVLPLPSHASRFTSPCRRA